MVTTNPNRRKFLKMVGAGGVGVSLAGCAGGDQNDGDGGGSEGTTTTTEQDGQSSGGGDNELVFAATQVFGTIDPAKQNDYTEAIAAVNFYDPFVTTDWETNKPSGHLVTEWNTEDDGKTWVFTLRDDVPHQQGGTLSADDVVYSMNRVLAIGKGPASLWSDRIDQGDVSKRDGSTVEFAMNEAYGPLMASLTQFFVVDSETVKENEADGEFGERGDYGQQYLSKNVAGTGSYLLEDWQQGSTLKMTAFDDYWMGWPDNRFDKVRAEVVSEISTIKNMMKLGEADLTDWYLGRATYEEMGSYSNVDIPTSPQIQIFHIPMNTQKPPLDDIHVRKAIHYAFDYESAVNEIVGGGSKAAGPVPKNLFGHNDSIEEPSQDMEKAQAELDQAEYSVSEINDIGLEHAVIAGIESQRQFGLLNQSGLKKLGIDLEINPIQWSTLTERAARKEDAPHMANIYLSPIIPSPDNYTYFMYHPDAAGTYWSISWYFTDELTDVLTQTRKETDFDARMELYKEAQQMIVDGFPSIFVANPPYRVGMNKNVGGFEYRAPMSFEMSFNHLHRKGDGRAK